MQEGNKDDDDDYSKNEKKEVKDLLLKVRNLGKKEENEILLKWWLMIVRLKMGNALFIRKKWLLNNFYLIFLQGPKLFRFCF